VFGGCRITAIEQTLESRFLAVVANRFGGFSECTLSACGVAD